MQKTRSFGHLQQRTTKNVQIAAEKPKLKTFTHDVAFNTRLTFGFTPTSAGDNSSWQENNKRAIVSQNK